MNSYFETFMRGLLNREAGRRPVDIRKKGPFIKPFSKQDDCGPSFLRGLPPRWMPLFSKIYRSASAFADSANHSTWTVIRRAITPLVKNETARQFLTLSPEEQSTYFNYLVRANATAGGAHGPSGQDTASPGYKSQIGVVRKHFQLPCSPATQRQRADWMEREGWRNRNILLLGDDDLVAVELAKRDFENVWVVDCDVKVLKTIDFLTRELSERPRTFLGDLSSPRFTAPCEADLVCIDPPYNYRWLRIFVEQAVKATGSRKGTGILLMLNPKCIRQSQFEQIKTSLAKRGFELTSHQPHFNWYPLNLISRGLVWLGCVLLIRRRVPAGFRNIGFGSDLFLFRRT